jgi:hypothetical protein
MIVRLADPQADQEQILIGLRDFVSRMEFTDFLPPDHLFEPFVVQLLSNPAIETSVVEHEGRLVAGLGLAYIPFVWNPQLTQADEMFFWAAPDAPTAAAMKVLRFSLSRIRERAAVTGENIMASFRKLTSSPQALSRVYGRMGLREVETTYIGHF